jgi:hypothetical protein
LDFFGYSSCRFSSLVLPRSRLRQSHSSLVGAGYLEMSTYVFRVPWKGLFPHSVSSSWPLFWIFMYICTTSLAELAGCFLHAGKHSIDCANWNWPRQRKSHTVLHIKLPGTQVIASLSTRTMKLCCTSCMTIAKRYCERDPRMTVKGQGHAVMHVLEYLILTVTVGSWIVWIHFALQVRR